MSDYEGLGTEHEDLRELVRRFAIEVIKPVAASNYESESFPYDLVRQLGELGLFGIGIPEEAGGSGGDALMMPLVLEELARVDVSIAITLEAATSLGAEHLYRFGSDAQRSQYLPSLCRGESLAGFGLTEPSGGSDAGSMRTTAKIDGGDWVISGSKSFITNSGTDITAYVAVAAVSGVGANGRPEISTIIVPRGTVGFSVAKGYSKVGWLSSDTHELFFDDCRVPEENLLGERGRGYANFLDTLDVGRIGVAAISAGVAQGCLDECVGYANERAAFGHKLGEYQAIQFKLADMQARAHTARLSYLHAALARKHGRPFKRDAAIAKLVASNAAMENAREATQIFGGAGFMNESAVGRFYRDAKALEIGEGTNEVLRMLIARDLGFRPAS